MSFRVVGIGEALWDLLPGNRQVGGSPANFACIAAALGAEAAIVSRVGRDDLGRELIERLNRLGVRTDAMEVDDKLPTGSVRVELAPDGQPQFFIAENVAWDALRGEAAGRDAVSTADAVCFGSMGQRSEPARSSIRALLAATRAEAWRIFDVNLRQHYYSGGLLHDCLSLANALKVSDAELPRLAEPLGLAGDDRAQIAELARRYKLRCVAYTRGEKGSLLYANGQWSDHAGRKTHVVDTVGAGDAFTAAMTLGLLAGWTLDEVNDRAAEVAAFVCSQSGATPPLPEPMRARFRAALADADARRTSAARRPSSPGGRTLSGLLAIFLSCAAEGAEVTVDFSRTNGVLRWLHGGNNGPLGYGELVDVTEHHRAVGVPLTRLHDCAWPYPDIVDIHAVFPNPAADPALPGSYRFGPTDDYLRAITNTGARIVYRLGESIEHAKRKRYVHPPADPEAWAAVCAGIIRHYNEGWADGHHLGITYWEIWNEPENRPAMWTGTPEQYCRLYSVTARALKARWPHLKIGGPSLGHQGDYRDGKLQPSAFLRGFIEHIRRERAPLDFFSWHHYTDDPAEPARRARAVRAFLDGAGFRETESHLNEWNYLPDRDWKPMTSAQGRVREAWYARQGGAEGAAFAACVLMELQSAPLDAGNFYSADNQPFGWFTLHGTPKKCFQAFRAFRGLLEAPVRAECRGGEPGQSAVCAGVDLARGQARILLGNLRARDATHRIAVRGLDWGGPTVAEIFLLNASWDLESIRRERHEGGAFQMTLELPSPAVALVRLGRLAANHP